MNRVSVYGSRVGASATCTHHLRLVLKSFPGSPPSPVPVRLPLPFPTSPSPWRPSVCILCLWVYLFCIFHEMESYNTWPLGSGLSPPRFRGPPTLSRVSVPPSLPGLSSAILCLHRGLLLHHPLMGARAASSLGCCEQSGRERVCPRTCERTSLHFFWVETQR